MMRKKAVAVTLVLVAGLAWAWRPSRSLAQDEVTLRGEVVDLACYLPKGSKGPSHKSCAQMCAKKGAPLGLLTDSGELYLLLDDHDNPAPYEAAKKLAGERAEIKGKKFVKQGVASIVVGASNAL